MLTNFSHTEGLGYYLDGGIAVDFVTMFCLF